MKNYLNIISLILFSVLFFNSNLTGQSNTFNWNDTVFEIGSTRQIYLFKDCKLPCNDLSTVYDACRKMNLVYDTIIQFLKVNPDIKIQIDFHSDTVGSKNYNQHLTDKRANEVLNELLRKGGLSRQFQGMSYGEDMPLNTSNPNLNQRTVVRIIKNEIPFYIQAIQKDTSIHHIYNEQGDFFKIKKDTNYNQNLDKLAIFLEKLFQDDTTNTFGIEWCNDTRGSERYSHISLRSKARQYLLDNYNLNEDAFIEKDCYNSYFLLNKRIGPFYFGVILVSKTEHLAHPERLIIKRKITERCDSCPF